MGTSYDQIADEYIRYRNDIPGSFVDNIELRGVEIAGAKIADLGAGPGYLTDMLTEKGGIIDAVDPTVKFIEFAREKFKDNQRATFINRFAEDTGLSSNTYDIVIVMRAWHWFDRDEVIEEVKRILKPGGYLIVGDVGFTGSSKVVKQSMRIIRKSAKHYSVSPVGSKGYTDQLINNFPVEWFDEWNDEKLDLVDMFKKEFKVKFNHDDWMGRMSSVSALSTFKDKQRQKVLEEIEQNLIDNHDKNKYKVPHIMSVAILKNKNQLD